MTLKNRITNDSVICGARCNGVISSDEKREVKIGCFWPIITDWCAAKVKGARGYKSHPGNYPFIPVATEAVGSVNLALHPWG